jgi:hypothetical protein
LPVAAAFFATNFFRFRLRSRRVKETMERNDGRKLKITTGLVAAAVIGLTVQAQGGHNDMNADMAEHTLVYGRVDQAWIARTSQLVAAQPELAARLGRIASSNAVDDVRRGQVLDALARAGSDSAEKAMRESLTALSTAGDPVYPVLLGKLGQLTAPSAETLSYVSVQRMRAFDDGNEQLAFAAQQTLDDVYGHRLARLYKSARKARLAPSRQRSQ